MNWAFAPHAGGIKDDQTAARLVAATMNLGFPGGLFVVSMYLRDGKGLSQENCKLPKALETIVLDQNKPWIAKGTGTLSHRSSCSADGPKKSKGKW